MLCFELGVYLVLSRCLSSGVRSFLKEIIKVHLPVLSYMEFASYNLSALSFLFLRFDLSLDIIELYRPRKITITYFIKNETMSLM